MKKGFNTTDVGKDLLYIIEELGEAVKSFRKGSKDELAEEIADIMIYSLGLMEMLGKDGYQEIMKKNEKNEKREYQATKEGFHLREDQK